jgi:hypothetical protein
LDSTPIARRLARSSRLEEEGFVMWPTSVRARLLELAVGATLVAGMALGAPGCGGNDKPRPAAQQGTAPARGFSEDVPADATVPVTAELEQALTELQAAIKAAATRTDLSAAREAELAKMQEQAAKLRSNAGDAYNAALVSGLLQTSQGIVSGGGALMISTKPLTDYNRAASDALKKLDIPTTSTDPAREKGIPETSTAP